MLAALTLPAPSTVDLHFEAVPVSRVVAALAHDVAKPLACSPSVGKEIVAVSLRGTSPAVAMSRLAEALDASWVKSKDGYTLTRTAGDLSHESRRMQEAFAVAYREENPTRELPVDISACAKALATIRNDHNATDEEVKKASRYLESRGPNQQLLRAMTSFSPQFVLSLTGRQVVYSTSPYPFQLPATPQQKSAFAEYVRQLGELESFGPTGPTFPPSKSVAHFKLILTGEPNAVRGRLITFDSNLQPTSMLPIGVSAHPTERYRKLVPRPSERLLATKVLPPPVDWRSNSIGNPLLDVGHTDPLAPIAGWLAKSARVRDGGLIAVLGDDLVWSAPQTPIRPTDFLNDLPAKDYRVEERGGIVTIVPFNPILTRLQRCDRAALREWLEKEWHGERLSLNDFFRLGRRLPKVEDEPPLYLWLADMGIAADWNTSLLETIQSLPRNRSLRFGALAPYVRESIRRLVLAKGPGDYRERPGFICGTVSPFFEDPTDKLPDGIPDDAMVRLDEASERVLVDGTTPSLADLYFEVGALGSPDVTLPKLVRVTDFHWIDFTVEIGKGVKYQNRIGASEHLTARMSPAVLSQRLHLTQRQAPVKPSGS